MRIKSTIREELKAAAKNAYDALAPQLSQNPGTTVLEGYSLSPGNEGYRQIVKAWQPNFAQVVRIHTGHSDAE